MYIYRDKILDGFPVVTEEENNSLELVCKLPAGEHGKCLIRATTSNVASTWARALQPFALKVRNVNEFML